MNKFDYIIHNKLLESIVTLGRDELDPAVFQPNANGLPILRDNIKVQILKDIDQIRAIIPVSEFYLVGGILTRNYERTTEISVSVRVDEQLIDSIATADLMHLLVYINGCMAGDTMHKINYYIVTHSVDQTSIGAIYDIINERWIKAPALDEPVIETILNRFQDTIESISISSGKLTNNLVDLNELQGMDHLNLKRLRKRLLQDLAGINELLRHLTKSHSDIDIGNMTPGEFVGLGTGPFFPENVIRKLLEMFYYKKFIGKIEDVLDEKNELGLTDAPEVQRAMEDAWKVS